MIILRHIAMTFQVSLGFIVAQRDIDLFAFEQIVKPYRGTSVFQLLLCALEFFQGGLVMRLSLFRFGAATLGQSLVDLA